MQMLQRSIIYIDAGAILNARQIPRKLLFYAEIYAMLYHHTFYLIIINNVKYITTRSGHWPTGWALAYQL